MGGLFIIVDDNDKKRKKGEERWAHKRIDWKLHVQKLLHEKMFHKEYRMPHAAFVYLCIILGPAVTRNHSMSESEEPITVEITVACGLRILAGGTQPDQKHIFGLSKTEVHRTFRRFLRAVNDVTELEIKLPATPDEWEKVRYAFEKKSRNSLFDGCVGAIDGFFQPTTCPTVKEVGGNVVAYYSGHYESYGLNCQAACDANLRFHFFGVVGPGKTNDNVAFPRCGILYDKVNKLPIGLYFLGDAAYTLSDTLLIPFTGSQRDDVDNDAYNFYLSQLRIRIEMAFGRLVRKWGILKKNMAYKLAKTSLILQVCAKLHNFVIDWQLLQKSLRTNDNEVNDDEGDDDEDNNDLHIVSDITAPSGMRYLPTLPQDDYEVLEGVSTTRIVVVEKIKEMKYRRPKYNTVRNNRQAIPTNDNVVVDGHVVDELMYHPT